MFLKIWLANIVLAVAVFFTGMKSIEAWTERHPLKIASPQPTSDWSEKRFEKKEAPPETEYEVVVQGNLFSPDRSEAVEKPAEDAPAATQSIAVGPQLQMLEQMAKQTSLYGIVIADNRREAFIGEFAIRRPGTPGESGIKRVKVGDTVGRFQVKEIQNKGVVLAAEGHEWKISLFDKDIPKKRVPVQKETGPVVVGDASRPEAGQAPETGKEKERVPAAAIPTKPVPEKGQSSQVIFPVPDKANSDETPEAISQKHVPNIPGPGRR